MRTVVVSGVSRGLGLAIARRLTDSGYRVVGLSRTLSEDYDALMKSSDANAAFEHFDAADIRAIPDAVRTITQKYGPIFGLVNNAAIGNDGVLATMHQTDIDRLIRTNLLGPITLTKFISRGMLSRREGRVVNISSIIASTGFHGLSVYASTKAGLEGFTRSLARELGKMNVTVNCVAPGYMETEMTRGLDLEKFTSIRRRAPLGLPTPSDAAGAVAYLLSEDGARVSGTVLTVDGGSTA
jgi:3-oxoacyl-[acyl-carrier protein] reductase